MYNLRAASWDDINSIFTCSNLCLDTSEITAISMPNITFIYLFFTTFYQPLQARFNRT